MLNKSREDAYSWLRDKNWPEITDKKILAILDEEKQIADEFFQEDQAKIEGIFEEMKSKVPLQDFTVPIVKGDYYYYSFIGKKDQYWRHARRLKLSTTANKIIEDIFTKTAEKDIFLDEVLLSEGKEYFDLIHFEISHCHNFLAYAVDLIGDQRYTIIIKDLRSNKILAEIPNTMGSFLWQNQSKGLFYLPANEFWRADRLLYRGLDSSESQELYHEKDYTFNLRIEKTEDKEFCLILIESYTSTEVRAIDPELNLLTVVERQEGILHTISHWKGHFISLTNDKGDNNRLIKFSRDLKIQEEILPVSEIPLVNFTLKKNHLVLESRLDGLPAISLYSFGLDYQLTNRTDLTFPEASYSLELLETDFDADEILVQYSSLKQPKLVYSYDLETRTSIIRHQVLLPHFNPEEYVVKYEKVLSEKDGLEIPVTLFYKKGFDSKRPTLLYGYGAYGIITESRFRSTVIPLVDRGFIYAIAHIRGGGEKGKAWHEGGKKLNKKNSFEDFIQVSLYLKEKNYSSDLAIYGGSAGGILIGYCLNERPDLYKLGLMAVPFLDVLNTMLDDSLPLTPLEFKEWGNPGASEEYFNYILSYSPYDNIKQKNYPAIYISSGLQDPRVTYWEPLKFVRKLRNLQGSNPLILRMSNHGHSGSSGRFDYLREMAETFTFLLQVFNA